MSYKLIINWPEQVFEEVVTSHIRDGWELVGGPFIYRNMFCQAVTKTRGA